MAERIAAWLVTGPVGHGVAGVADWAVLLTRHAGARLRSRVGTRMGSRRARRGAASG